MNPQQSKGQAVLMSGVVAILVAAILLIVHHISSSRGD